MFFFHFSSFNVKILNIRLQDIYTLTRVRVWYSGSEVLVLVVGRGFES